MKKKDLIFYAGTAVLLAFSTQQVKADEQHASDQTPENTSAIVATTTSSEAQSTTADVVGNDQAVQTENTVATVATPVTPTPSSDKETNEKVPSEQPTTAVVASRAPYGARARVVESEDNSLPVEKVEKPSGTLTIENNNVETGTFDAVIRNVVAPNGLKEVLVPTWSDKDWQDDIVWHKAVRQSDGSYRATIKASDHKNEDGKYNVHVHFIDVNNRRSYVTETTTEVRQARRSGTILIQNNNKDTGTFDVIIKDVYSPKGVRTVQVPTWSDKDGQDDLRWYEATRQANGDYKVSVKASDHKNSTGKYHVHLYYIQNDGSRVGVGTTTTEVEFRNAMTKTQVAIKNVNATNGTYTVAVDQAPQGRQIKNIRVAARSSSSSRRSSANPQR